MAGIESYKKVFVENFSLTNPKEIEKLEYNMIPEWDSIGHMSLIANLEEEYKISLEIDDIINFSSFKNGIEILRSYGVSIPNPL